MLKKKLLTIAGVLAILACGACLMPPLPQHHAALPPGLSSVHNIAVDVEDRTASHLFDPPAMSNATASNFNELWSEFPVRANPFSARTPSDAVLKIAVLRKTASCTPHDNGKQFCSFEMISSYTLTAADGTILQSMPQKSAKFGVWYQGNSPPENLNANPFRHQASYWLAMTAGDLLMPAARAN